MADETMPGGGDAGHQEPTGSERQDNCDPRQVPFDSAEAYRRRGWPGAIPLPPTKKFPPPHGFTGAEGAWPSGADIAEWRQHGYHAVGEDHDAVNLALRLPPNVVGIDVDAYKSGAATLAARVAEWGPLPETWRSTSRTDGSGIALYRVPGGITGWPSQAGPDIEIIRYAHRYVVVAPSVHPEGGAYRWVRPDGTDAAPGEIPALGDLPELPATWLEGLTGSRPDGSVDTEHVKPGSRAERREREHQAREWLRSLPGGEPCRYVGKLAADALAAARREDGSGYENTRDTVLPLLRAAEVGHPGVPDQLRVVKPLYVATVADKRPRSVAEAEFDKFTLGAAEKILAGPSERAGRGCDCLKPLPHTTFSVRTNYEFNEEDEVTKKTLPTAHPAMFHGPIGEAVRALAPSTEAHPVAILLQILAVSGAMAGDGPSVPVGGSRHPARIWPLIMGATSKGRKGESRAQAVKFVSSFISFNSYFVETCMASGLSSGEGLLSAFNDHQDGTPADRRLVVTETEFARVLSVGKREGNTLPTILRELWDSGHARTMTKASPLKVDGVHLVVLGHITPRELKLKLADADVSGGTFNRFLPVLVERTKLLPEPPLMPDLRELSDRVDAALWAAHTAPLGRTYQRTAAGRAYWDRVYRTLDKVDNGGLLSEVVARAPAYVQRLALLYAVVDEATEIDVCHLRAALAVVKYSIDSCRIVFGDSAGAGDLGKLSAALQRAESKRLSLTEISALFNRNKSAAEVDALVTELQDEGRVTRTEEAHDKGKPTVWITWTGKPAPDLLQDLLDTNYEVDEDHGPGADRPSCCEGGATKPKCQLCKSSPTYWKNAA